jgi:hypothetical protein
MTYRPLRRRRFGPPLRSWIAPATYFVLAAVLLLVVGVAHMQTSSSWLFRYIVEGDQHRILGARALALLVFLGGVAALARTAMRGVVVHPDGIEARDIVLFSWPRVRNCSWAEIDEFVFEPTVVGIGLWSGDRLWLPPVFDDVELRRALERAAAARGIPMRGKAARLPEQIDAEPLEEG